MVFGDTGSNWVPYEWIIISRPRPLISIGFRIIKRCTGMGSTRTQNWPESLFQIFQTSVRLISCWPADCDWPRCIEKDKENVEYFCA